uniref:hypothetical protein n=1 Tax=Trichocoleus desertorum TaxID=1481672 RepID=UPI0025B3864A|nr:hypothetical protein [Trichocoleus desertorum]
MLAHRIETTITQNGTLTLENLPFHSGELVEVIILAQPHRALEQNRYPLRDTKIQYTNPLDPVDQDEWEGLK